MKQINFEVLSEDADSRIDRYLAQQMPDQSRSFLQKLIREEQITVNGRPVKANYRLQPEDQVLVIVPDPQLPDILPENIPLDPMCWSSISPRVWWYTRLQGITPTRWSTR